MPRAEPTGTLEWKNGKLWAKASLPDGSRPRELVPPEFTTEADRERFAAEFSASERAAYFKKLATASTSTTVRQFGERWTSGKLYADHGEVRGLRVKRSAAQDVYRLEAYVYPLIGPKAVRDVTEQDIERVLAAYPAKAREKYGREPSQGSKRHMYVMLHRLFELAVRPGRLREVNPVNSDVKPRNAKPKLYGYLYPDELVKLLGCRKVPVARRVLYVLGVYTGLRKGSLLALAWPGVDFKHRTLTSLESKTGLPQLFEIRADVAELLSGWRILSGEPKAGPIVRGLEEPERLAEQLRDDLKAAGVDREQLLKGSKGVQAIRFHDTRATFVTWARREGRGWGWITDRTGHFTPSQVDRYNRQARTLEDLQIVPFPDVSKAIPEIVEAAANVARIGSAG